MKFLKWSLICLIFGFSYLNPVLANTTEDDPNLELRSVIANLIQKPDLSSIEVHENAATVEFLVNGENQIVVLFVQTTSDYLEHYIKDRLNYKKVNIEGIKRFAPFKLKFVFVKHV